ncbi:zincin [Anaeromyces robustus]|uniref:mitochondrial intermediate peptidase n=1 Tax=Anaeromyces robustus TaxID=1754192 RepID=A0A1Y1VWZ2_9FUNG|nr:zincin [Anaeromyces robustus]|eukprot:ORX65264.1 zincin [Anaeromyces robustus]
MQVNVIYPINSLNLVNKVSLYYTLNNKIFFSTTPNNKNKVCSPLKKIFNDTFYWNHYVKKINKNKSKHKFIGLCGFTNLNLPEELIQNAQLCVKYSNILVNTICNDYISNKNKPIETNTLKVNPQLLIVKRLDRLSDKLCSMIDTFELLRNVHPNPKFINAANEAYEILNNYFGQLNTNFKLYKALKDTIDNELISSKLTEEEKVVAQLLLEDFENSGIHMTPEKRKKFIELQDKIAKLGHKFTLNAYTEFNPIEVENPREILKGLPYRLQNYIIYRYFYKGKPIPYKEIAIINDLFIAQQILQTVENEEIRKKIYLELNSSSNEQIQILEEMLFLRGDLANLLGFSSYTEMNIKDKMAKNQDNVLNFLKNMSKIYKPLALKEIKELLKLKKKHETKPQSIFKKTEFYPWDYQYYTNIHKNENYNKEELSNRKRLYGSLLSYFSVGTIIDGLSNLYSHLYGISFQPSTSISKSELWHNDVRKLDVIHETEGKIGTIYCDFFTRPNPSFERKYENAAHFTIQCARRVDFDQYDLEMNENLRVVEALKSTSTPEQQQQESVMMKQIQQPVKYFEGKGTYQLPIVVIVTNFERPLSEYHNYQQSNNKDDHYNDHTVSKPSFLTWSEMETLFHEMGHAVHSILARTNFQNISGTRCKMDFVEVPSILMEYFLRSDEVISSVAHHYLTDEPLKPKYIDIMKNNLSQNYNSNKYINLQTQLKLSVLDQIYHSSIFNKHSNKLSDRFYNKNVTKEIDIYPYIQNTHWQGQFTHLYSYGSTYYTYFWCRRIAEELWNKLFNSNSKSDANSNKSEQSSKEEDGKQFNKIDPLRKLGEKLKNELLQWGGARDPWIGLKNLGIVDGDINDETFVKNLINKNEHTISK